MKKHFLLFLLAAVMLFAVFPVQAGEDLIWSNINNDPVKNRPPLYKVISIKENEDPVLVQRIRTYHWNSGEGAEPGTISVYEGETKLGAWQAIGRSGYGAQNVYWDALVDVIFYPGHSYTIKVSNLATMSYNEGSDNCGMFEIYGIRPAPEGYVVAAPAEPASQTAATAPSVPPVSPAPVSQPSVSQSSRTAATVAMIPADTFKFGRYEQDNNFGNGTESIDWQVLTVAGDRQLVISRYILDYRNFVDGMYSSKWDTSAMRKWLNEDFYNSAFTAAEKNSILLVTNNNPNNERFGTSGGSQTQDRIFLLSNDEANRYFSTSGHRVTRPTAYAQQRYYSSNGMDQSEWLLRSPGSMENTSSYVNTDGTINYEGSYNNLNGIPTEYAVRPAFWMKTATGYSVKYNGNNCLSVVPVDWNLYQPGDKVTVLFDPVEYIPGLIFNGWDWNGDGGADFGYAYYTFIMPNRNVELYAICYVPYIQERPVDTPVQRPVDTPVQRPYDPQGQWPPDYYPDQQYYDPGRSDYIPGEDYYGWYPYDQIPPFSDAD